MVSYHQIAAPCRFFTKGFCRTGDQCRFMHGEDSVIQPKCKDYFDCNRSKCKKKHASALAMEHRARSKVEAAEQSRIASETYVEQKRQEAATRQQKAAMLASNLDGWKAKAALEISTWQAEDLLQLRDNFDDLTTMSPRFAAAVDDTPSSKRRRITNDKIEIIAPIISVGNYDWIRLVWIDCLMHKGIWQPSEDSQSDAQSEGQSEEERDVNLHDQFDESNPWDVNNQLINHTFRHLFSVLFKVTDLSAHQPSEFVEWLTDQIGSCTPDTLACILHCGFECSSEVALPMLQESFSDWCSTMFDAAEYAIITQGLSVNDIKELVEDNGTYIELLLGLELKKAGEFARIRFLQGNNKEGNIFEQFKDGYAELMEVLGEVAGMDNYKQLYSAIFDNHYSYKHYKAAIRNFYANRLELVWKYSEFDEELLEEWREFNCEEPANWTDSDDCWTDSVKGESDGEY